ncbi:MAG: hypothetical protein HOE90_20755 [Bacteriovoracaceae bacterium]|jgi:hypothetical protein|nr:hypothetical protein [Bacteriovoracaceae bacterium]
MKRIHLFEFEDLSWFPTSIRNYGTDFLRALAVKTRIYQRSIPIIKKAIDDSGTGQVVDLCSGGGGGWESIAKSVKKDIPGLKIHLTDYYPNIDAFERIYHKAPEVFTFDRRKIDALAVPDDLKGIRTLFLCFHHFDPVSAKKIIQDAVNANCSIAIFEAQKRDLFHFILFLFSPLGVAFITPFVKPFSLKRIFFTYIIPVVPSFILWDGLISVLRSYKLEEIQQMTYDLSKTHNYKWESGRIKTGPSSIFYFVGHLSKTE